MWARSHSCIPIPSTAIRQCWQGRIRSTPARKDRLFCCCQSFLTGRSSDERADCCTFSDLYKGWTMWQNKSMRTYSHDVRTCIVLFYAAHFGSSGISKLEGVLSKLYKGIGGKSHQCDSYRKVPLGLRQSIWLPTGVETTAVRGLQKKDSSGMQNSSYKNGETLVMGWCMQGVLFLRVQYQKIMTHLPQSIVCMAYRTGQTAVASIPRRAALSGLLGPLSVFAQSASDVSASGLRNGIGSYAGLLARGGGTASRPDHFVERVYDKAEGMSRGEIG